MDFAVVTQHSVLCSGTLHRQKYVVAMTEACKLAKEKAVIIDTDSRYAFGIILDFPVEKYRIP